MTPRGEVFSPSEYFLLGVEKSFAGREVARAGEEDVGGTAMPAKAVVDGC